MFNPWFALSVKAVQLGIEAQSVIALRMMRLASGGARAKTEMGRMVIDKAAAIAEAQVAAATAVARGHKDHVVVGKTLRVFGNRVQLIGEAHAPLSRI